MDEDRIYTATIPYDYQKIITKKRKFKDPDFKPVSKSLYDSFNSKLDKKILALWKSFEWKKA